MLSKSTPVYCDNVSVVYHPPTPFSISVQNMPRSTSTSSGNALPSVIFMSCMCQFTNIFTKGMLTSMFLKFRFSLNIHRG
jgi:hypothetical protein